MEFSVSAVVDETNQTLTFMFSVSFTTTGSATYLKRENQIKTANF